MQLTNGLSETIINVGGEYQGNADACESSADACANACAVPQTLSQVKPHRDHVDDAHRACAGVRASSLRADVRARAVR